MNRRVEEWIILACIFGTIGIVIAAGPSMITKDEAHEAPQVNHELTKAHELIEDVFNIEIADGFTSYSIPVTASAYTARAQECDVTPEVTADMTPSRIGLLAVSRDLIEVMGFKFGDIVMLTDGGESLGVFVIRDVMNARYTNRVDILHASAKAARLFGVKRSVLLVRVVGDDL